MRSFTAGAVLVSLLSGVALIPCSVAYADPQELKVLRVTPEGDDVPTTRQIVIEFNRPVVSLGQMDRTAEEVGVTISPATKCQWRWLNTSSLACQLDEKNSLPLATKFELNIAPRIAAIDGGKLAVAETHHFITERPATGYADFQTWKGPSSPVIRLIFNQPVSKSSVEKSLSFKDILSGKKQASIVTADDTDHEAPVVLPLPNEKKFIFFERFLRKNDNQTTLMNGEEARRIWILEPKDPLPEDAEISLYRDAGLISAVGPEKCTNPADVVTFRTFPAPRFMGVHCSDNNNQDVLISPNASEKTDQKCSPLRSVSLRFATPMLRSIVKNNIQFMPDLSGGDANLKPWGEENRDYSRLGEPYRKDMSYDVWLPIGLKAAQTYTLDIATKKSGLLQNVLHKMKATKAVGIADEFDRGLPSDIHMSFKTDHRPPNYELNYSDAVLEKGIDSEVPLYVNNLSSIQFDYTTASAGASEQHVSLKKDVNPIEDIQYAVPLGVRDMLHGKSGVVYGHIDTTPKTRKLFEEVRLFAQVTPFQCDLKLGHFSSIVWVTDLATGQPVEGAKVAIYNSSFTDIASMKEPLATAVSN
ncbi:MAG: large extracellular alpha-helical protein, partial [Pseudomonadota bacterium]